MPVTPMSFPTCCPATQQFHSKQLLDLFPFHFFSLTVSGFFFSLLHCHFAQFFLIVEKLPSFFVQPKNNTSNKCKIRKIKSGIFSRFRFVCDLTTRPGLRACEFYVIPFLFVFLWNLPFVRDVHETVVHTLENYIYREEIRHHHQQKQLQMPRISKRKKVIKSKITNR